MFGRSNKSPSVRSTEVDLESLDQESRNNLHQLLYRQECRARLLWCLLGIASLTWVGSVEEELARWEYWSLNVFGVMYTERGFDSSWPSVWDFVQPLAISALLFLLFLLVRVIVACEAAAKENIVDMLKYAFASSPQLKTTD